MPSKYKIAASAASSAAKAGWLSKIFSGVSTALKGVGRFIGSPWVTAALIGWDLYSMYDSDSDPEDPASILAEAGRAKDITTILYAPSILRCLTSPIADASALSLAFTNCFLKATSSVDPLARFRSLSYAVMADYLLKAPDLNIFVYSSDRAADLLAELNEVIATNLEEVDASQIESLALSGSDISSSPPDVRRLLDYTAHYAFTLKKETENE